MGGNNKMIEREIIIKDKKYLLICKDEGSFNSKKLLIEESLEGEKDGSIN
jgi:hypothetical protein